MEYNYVWLEEGAEFRSAEKVEERRRVRLGRVGRLGGDGLERKHLPRFFLI